jgi:hypothetical protein
MGCYVPREPQHNGPGAKVCPGKLIRPGRQPERAEHADEALTF